MWDRFSTTNAWEDECHERVAPFRFSLVSIEPSIIIATPQEYPFDTRPRAAWKLYVQMQGLDVGCLRNDLELGATAPNVGQAQWYSPELGGEFRSIVWDADSAEIKVLGAFLRLRRNGDKILVTRVK